MESGIPVLTPKGHEALKNTPPELTALCRNILIQIDGKKSVEDIQNMFRGLKGFEEGFQRLFAGNFIQVSRACQDLVTSLVKQLLGAKAPTLVKKIEDLHTKYGEQCWEHLDEVDKVARMFYGEVVADQLKLEISKILKETSK